MMRNFKQIISKAQMSETSAEKCLRMLLEMYKESDRDKFFLEFLDRLACFLSQNYKQKNPYVLRGIQFFAKFSVLVNDNPEKTGEFLAGVFNYVLERHNSTSCIWRYRVCEFLSVLLGELSQECCLDDHICDAIIEAMAIRLTDTTSGVKLQAVSALERLQSPNDPNDFVTKKYGEHLNDDNVQVRKKILECLATSILTISYFIERILDVDTSVRVIAYNRIAKCPMKMLKIEQRQFVLRNMFKEPDKKINPASVIFEWFKSYKGDYFNFLIALKLDADEEEMMNTLKLYEQVLDVFFKNELLKDLINALKLDENNLIPLDVLTWEMIVFWRCLIKHVTAELEENEYIDQIRPVLTHFCDFILEIYQSRPKHLVYWELIQHDFVIFDLVKMAADFDLSDEVGRRALTKLLTDILIDVKISNMTIMEIEKIFEQLIPDVEKRVEAFCTIISEIRDPLVVQPVSQENIRMRELKIADLKVKLNIMRDKRDTAVEKKEFDVAKEAEQAVKEIRQELKQARNEFKETDTVSEKRNDVNTIASCLDIFISVMMSDDVKTIPTAALLPLEEFVLPMIVNTAPKIVAKALKGLALCCYVDKKRAEDNIYIFCLPLLTYKYLYSIDYQTLLVAVPACVDMTLLYGPQIFLNEKNTMNTTTRKDGKRKLLRASSIEDLYTTQVTFEDVIEIIITMLYNENDEVRNMAGICIAKLLKNGLVHCPNLITQLLIKWFHPLTMKENYLSQLLGDALTYYGELVPGSLEVIVDAFVPTISVVVNAPDKSPLLDINLDFLVKFMCALCDSRRHVPNEGLDGHKAVTLKIFTELTNKPNSKAVYVCLKTLMLLNLQLDDELAIKDLQKQVDILLELIKDKKCRTWLLKYKQRLEGGGTVANGSLDVNVTGESITRTGSVDNSRQTNTSVNSSIRISAVNVASTNNNTDTDTDSSLSGKTPSMSKRKLTKTKLTTIKENTDVENSPVVSETEKTTPSNSDSDNGRSRKTSVKERRRLKKRKN